VGSGFISGIYKTPVFDIHIIISVKADFLPYFSSTTVLWTFGRYFTT
jgi:hypothetical protein